MTWVKLDHIYFDRRRPPANADRVAVVRLKNRDLDPATIDAWNCGRGDMLERMIRIELQDVKGLPHDVAVLAMWGEPEWNETRVLVRHESFRPVRDGERPDVFDPCCSIGGELHAATCDCCSGRCAHARPA